MKENDKEKKKKMVIIALHSFMSSSVEWLVVDESDRLFEGGARGFRDQLAAVYRACTGPNIRRALFSATFSHDVQHWCKLNLNNVAMVTVGIR